MIVDHHHTSVTATLSAPSVRSVPPDYFNGAYHCSPGQRRIGSRDQLGLACSSCNDGPHWWSCSLWYACRWVGGGRRRWCQKAAAVGCSCPRHGMRWTQATHQSARTGAAWNSNRSLWFERVVGLYAENGRQRTIQCKRSNVVTVFPEKLAGGGKLIGRQTRYTPSSDNRATEVYTCLWSSSVKAMMVPMAFVSRTVTSGRPGTWFVSNFEVQICQGSYNLNISDMTPSRDDLSFIGYYLLWCNTIAWSTPCLR